MRITIDDKQNLSENSAGVDQIFTIVISQGSKMRYDSASGLKAALVKAEDIVEQLSVNQPIEKQ